MVGKAQRYKQHSHKSRLRKLTLATGSIHENMLILRRQQQRTRWLLIGLCIWQFVIAGFLIIPLF